MEEPRSDKGQHGKTQFRPGPRGGADIRMAQYGGARDKNRGSMEEPGSNKDSTQLN